VGATTSDADQNVGAIKLLTIPDAESGQVQAAVPCGQHLYLAGKSWNPKDKSSLWLWQIDGSAERRWELQVARQERNEQLTVVGLLPGARRFEEGGSGVRVVYRTGLQTKLAFFTAGGEQVFEKDLGRLETTRRLVAGENDSVYLLGTTTVTLGKPIHAWVARVTRLGTLLWKRQYLAGPSDKATATEQAAKVDEVPDGFLQVSYLLDGASFPDGSLVLVGQTGIYNKFGQGESKLWLLRVDQDGEPLADAFIEGGRNLPSVRDLIANCTDGVIVPYTKQQLPPISQVPVNCPTEFGTRFASFDLNLEPRWDKRLLTTRLPNWATLTGPAPCVSLSAQPDVLLVQAISDPGVTLWETRVATPDRFVTPLGILRREKKIVAVCSCMTRGREDGARLIQVLLVGIEPDPGT
jgi:hypothetical protein